MKTNFNSQSLFNFESLVACKWVITQLKLLEMLDEICPLRNLEFSIVKSKSEYPSLVGETETMKNEMASVHTKMRTIAGDVLLSSSFMKYNIFFDQSYRKAMWQGLADHLNQVSLKQNTELSLAECLSTAKDFLFNHYPLAIDPSAFTMFLSTRDPSVEFLPKICSRVTFVNFTMTQASLQSQSLSQALKVEPPNTEMKQTDLMKLQGEFKLHLLCQLATFHKLS
ncbi:hypothetical protein BY996DRAFT_6429574 [Phakopsora pachyrhizi]|nr:hypothetical protein BY996DRAFT_6429574 [Phakopsora pachyrhizi]